MDINISSKIDEILQTRQSKLPKIVSEIDRWSKVSLDLKQLDQVITSILHEQHLAEDLRVSLQSINVLSIESKIPKVISDLSWLKERFSRNTINIGVSGKARVGKSTLLQKISGLGEQQIPTGSGLPVTAVRSQIYHSSTQHRATIQFHSFVSFREEILKPYHKELGLLDILPSTVQDFQRMCYPESIENIPSKKTLLNRLKEMHKALPTYIDLLQSSVREKELDLEELREYVAYPTYEQMSLEQPSRKYLAVKEAKIECKFPCVAVNNLGIIDLPGLGELAVDTEKHHVQGLKNDIDLVILVKRPLEGMGYWGAEDGKALDLLDEARGYIESRKDFVFILINKGGVTDIQIKSLQDDIKRQVNGGSDSSLFQVIVADNADENSVQIDVLNPILKHLASRLGMMDQQIIDGTLQGYSVIEKQLNALLKTLNHIVQQVGYSGNSREVLDDLATALRNDLSAQLTDVVLDLQRQAKHADGEEFIEKIEALSQKIMTWVDNGFSDNNEGGVEKWKAMASKVTNRDRNNSSFSVHELNRIRVEISTHYCQLDEYFNETLLKKLFEQIAEILCQNLGNLLIGKTGKDALIHCYQYLTDASESCDTLAKAISNLLALKLEYRTQFHPRVREQLDNLNYEIENSEGQPEPIFRCYIGDVDMLFKEIRNLAIKATYNTKKALLQEVHLPKMVMFTAAEQFEDELIRSGNSERDFKRLAHSYSYDLWPERFREIETSNARIGKLRDCIDNLQQSISAKLI